MSGSDNQMHSPVFKWEWNINTIAILFTFSGGLIVAGYFINDVVKVNEDQSRSIGRLDTIVGRNSEAILSIANHELRIAAAERAILESIGNMRSVTDTANELKSDVRVILEIVKRVEGAQQRNGAAPAR